MAARKLEVMSQDEMMMQSLEVDQDEIIVNEEEISVDQVETAEVSAKVYSLADFRKSMGYSK